MSLQGTRFLLLLACKRDGLPCCSGAILYEIFLFTDVDEEVDGLSRSCHSLLIAIFISFLSWCEGREVAVRATRGFSVVRF